METIALDWETFTQVCRSVRKGEEITFIGVDIDHIGEYPTTNITIPAEIVANLELAGDEEGA